MSIINRLFLQTWICPLILEKLGLGPNFELRFVFWFRFGSFLGEHPPGSVVMNLQEKLSGLKGLVSPGRRRHKGDLTADMISPPLGDFRHTMHVGRGGDVFGDTSFLSNHGGSANSGNGDADSVSVSSPDNKIGAFLSRTLRHIRRGSDNRPRDAAKELSPPPPAVSPIIKNAISLPRLDVDAPNGSPAARALLPGSPPDREKSSYGESGKPPGINVFTARAGHTGRGALGWRQVGENDRTLIGSLIHQ